MVTFVQATYMPWWHFSISNISAVAGLIFIKLFESNFFGVMIFEDQNVLGQNIFGPKFFGPKIFQGTKFVDKQFSGLKKLCEPKHFQIQILLDPKAFFHTQHFFQKKISDPKFFSNFFFRPKIFFKSFFGPKIYFCPKVLKTQKFVLTHKFFQTKNLFGPNICSGLEDFHWKREIKAFPSWTLLTQVLLLFQILKKRQVRLSRATLEFQVKLFLIFQLD